MAEATETSPCAAPIDKGMFVFIQKKKKRFRVFLYIFLGDTLECAVCLQNCVHPAQLPCGHIFCFLCVKGIANQSKKCAMCRQEIPRDFVEQPHLLERSVEQHESEGVDGGYQWFYEGRNGNLIIYGCC